MGKDLCCILPLLDKLFAHANLFGVEALLHTVGFSHFLQIVTSLPGLAHAPTHLQGITGALINHKKHLIWEVTLGDLPVSHFLVKR